MVCAEGSQPGLYLHPAKDLPRWITWEWTFNSHHSEWTFPKSKILVVTVQESQLVSSQCLATLVKDQKDASIVSGQPCTEQGSTPATISGKDHLSCFMRVNWEAASLTKPVKGTTIKNFEKFVILYFRLNVPNWHSWNLEAPLKQLFCNIDNYLNLII